jgi:hypothetical protein
MLDKSAAAVREVIEAGNEALGPAVKITNTGKEILKKLGVPRPKGRPAFSIRRGRGGREGVIAETDNEFVCREGADSTPAAAARAAASRVGQGRDGAPRDRRRRSWE